MNLRGARSIASPRQNLVKPKLGNLEQFKTDFRAWVSDSTMNELKNLNDLTHMTVCAGTAQAFDHFYIKHHRRRFRWFRGEFMYHRATLKENFNCCLLNDDVIRRGDAVILSCPFSDMGSKHPHTDDILELCDSLGVPLLLDLAYLPLSRNIALNFRHSCIDAAVFSISKFYNSAENLRVGVRFQRVNRDDGIDVFNQVNMVNLADIRIAHEIITSWEMDRVWEEYGGIYADIIREMELTETDCLMFGLDTLNRYPELNRGNDSNRVCISDLIAERLTPHTS